MSDKWGQKPSSVKTDYAPAGNACTGCKKEGDPDETAHIGCDKIQYNFIPQTDRGLAQVTGIDPTSPTYRRQIEASRGILGDKGPRATSWGAKPKFP